jgi:hypothetical protein
MKRIFVMLLLLTDIATAGIRVTPAYVGSGTSDSVVVTFCTFDTTLYPRLADADSIIALRFDPDNTMVDSLSQTAANLFKVRKGWYEIHYRGSNTAGTLGSYRVYARVKIGGDWRGAASAGYRVIGKDVGDYFTQLVADADSIKDTLGLLTERTTGSGSGAYACTLFVFESTSQAAIQGVFLRALNATETATAAIGETDSNGKQIFSLDAASYHLLPYLTGYSFGSLPQAVTVTAAGVNDTIWGSRFDPGSPPSASLCRVYGYVQSLGAGGLEEVTVTARITKTPLQYNGVVVSPYGVSTGTDSTGYWYLDLIPNGDLQPDDTKYDFTFYYSSGTILRKQVVVPDSASYWLRW